MLIQTKNLIGLALDYAAGKARGLSESELYGWGGSGGKRELIPWATNPTIAAKTNEDAEIAIQPVYEDGELVGWMADSKKLNSDEGMHSYGPTPAVAAARCLIRARIGEEVEIPADLVPEELLSLDHAAIDQALLRERRG